MRILREIPLSEFPFWSGAKETAGWLTEEDFEVLERVLFEDELYTETEINDIFWFGEDTIARCLGYENWESLTRNREAESEC